MRHNNLGNLIAVIGVFICLIGASGDIDSNCVAIISIIITGIVISFLGITIDSNIKRKERKRYEEHQKRLNRIRSFIDIPNEY